jgi:hypothetical protein
MTDFRSPPEPGPQPDPMLEPGRRSSGWVWLFGFGVIAIVVVTLYGINNQEPQVAANDHATTETSGSGSNAAPQSSLAAGRGTADAPKEQQSQGQTGQGTGAEQNPAAGTQGDKNVTTGQGAPQGDHQSAATHENSGGNAPPKQEGQTQK